MHNTKRRKPAQSATQTRNTTPAPRYVYVPPRGFSHCSGIIACDVDREFDRNTK